MLSRRSYLILSSLFGTAIWSSRLASAQQVSDNIADQLREIAEDPSFAELNNSSKEEGFRQIGPSAADLRGNADLPHRWVSDKLISPDAISLIVAFEITSAAHYSRALSRPTWPQGRSGVTIGIGYDLGYASAGDIKEDWLSIVDASTVARLLSVQGIKGPGASDAARGIQDVEIVWDAAYRNFVQALRYYAGETIHYFPNTDQLSPDSFGALVSLVYNRGSATAPVLDDPIDRRLEMREIKQLCLARQFDKVPDEIRKMKRLWQNGLVRRRELEALLFERGLRST